MGDSNTKKNSPTYKEVADTILVLNHKLDTQIGLLAEVVGTMEDSLEEVSKQKGPQGDPGKQGEKGEGVAGKQGEPGERGGSYILTPKDKTDIASSIKVPVVEKVIERTDFIIEKPIVTNEIREVAILETAEEIKGKLESLKGEDRIDASAIKNLPQPKAVYGGGMIQAPSTPGGGLSNPVSATFTRVAGRISNVLFANGKNIAITLASGVVASVEVTGITTPYTVTLDRTDGVLTGTTVT